MQAKTFIRMSGLGGQGVVTAAHILGSAAVRSGLLSTVNPFFGAEKRLAPAESYVRISSQTIHERGEVLFPDIIMIFHPHVITLGKSYTMPFFDGLQKQGKIIINAPEPLPLNESERAQLAALNARLYYISATRLALEIAGTELSSNIAMLGALIAVTDLVSQQALEEALAERFGGTKKFVASGTTAALDDVLKSKFTKLAQLMDKNIALIEQAKSSIQEHVI
ncbi:MAG: 2-oxoacid:acceptor oxidoreductase family protein [Dethiobacter sp.]|jgi:pyruvate ferredoxin oxidoreductase gamma subunit|nr:2-oxoacid:acceptor oxidoreductase family protein [Dethiobacter sp.]